MDFKKNLLLRMSIIVNIILIFFGYMIGNLYIIQLIACVMAIFACTIYKFKINTDTKFWIIVLIFCLFSIAYSIDTGSTINFTLMMTLLVIVKVIYENSKNWDNFFVNAIYTCSIIHVFFTILQLILPDLVFYINNIILPAGAVQTNQELYAVGAYAGITGQTSVLAFYITICIAITFFKLMLKENKKVPYLIIFVLSILSLFLTGKRTMLIANVLTIIIFMIYILIKDTKKRTKYVLLFISVLFIGALVIINVPQARTIIEKNIILEDSENILNGRDYLWEKTFDVFQENMLIGVGLSTIHNITGDYTHNVYIQLLGETGLIGTTIFIIALGCSLYCSIRKMKIVMKKDDIKNKLYVCIGVYIQIIFLIYCLSGNPLYGHFFIMPYILSIAMVNSINIEEN